MSEQTNYESLPASLSSLSDAELRRAIASLSKETSQETTSESVPVTGRICNTACEAAEVIGVTETTFQEWTRMPNFPGKAGGQNQRNAYWPIDEIKAWRIQRFGDRSKYGEASELRNRKLAAEVAQREASLRRELGEVVELEMARNLWGQAIAAARAKLEEIPERIAERLPGSKPRLRQLCAKISRDVVRKVLIELSGLTMGIVDQDDLEEIEGQANDSGDESRRANRSGRKGRGAKKPGRRGGKGVEGGASTET